MPLLYYIRKWFLNYRTSKKIVDKQPWRFDYKKNRREKWGGRKNELARKNKTEGEDSLGEERKNVNRGRSAEDDRFSILRMIVSIFNKLFDNKL